MRRSPLLPIMFIALSTACEGPSDSPEPGTPVLEVSPEVLDFGEVSASREPTTTRVVTLTNTGDGDLELGDITLAGNRLGLPGVDRSGRVLGPGRTINLTVQLTASADGPVEGRLHVPSNAGETVEVPILADILAPKVEVTPSSHGFGTVVVGCTPRLTVTVSNLGREELVLNQVVLDANDEWALETAPQDAPLLPGEGLGVVVRYQPNDPEPDAAELLIDTTDPDRSEVEVELEGSARFEGEAAETFGGGGTRYPLERGAVRETIRLFVNGDRVFSGWSYDDSQGPAIVFEGAFAPGDGDTVRVVYVVLGTC